jgi:hypothetical protein
MPKVRARSFDNACNGPPIKAAVVRLDGVRGLEVAD